MGIDCSAFECGLEAQADLRRRLSVLGIFVRSFGSSLGSHIMMRKVEIHKYLSIEAIEEMRRRSAKQSLNVAAEKVRISASLAPKLLSPAGL